MELVNDSDNMVRLKAFESCYKLIAEDYIESHVVTDEIFPAFMRLLDVIMEDEDGVNQLSGIIAMFTYQIWRKDKNGVLENADKFLKFFSYCIF